jgi:hypothetical protein
MYDEAKNRDFIVEPSIPILFFGDSERYSRSKVRVVTVGLNPSKSEFPDKDGFRRFPDVQSIYPEILNGKHIDKYLSALNNYFKRRPYGQWFGSYEPLLNGLGSSYYDEYESTALHTDFCSPLATNPTWTRLTYHQQESLEYEGVKLWRNLLSILHPNLVIVSIASKHLEKMEISEEWKAIYTVRRENPYIVRSSKMVIDNKATATIIFGKAANTPFGTVSYEDKRRIGSLIGRNAYGKS